MLDAWSLTKRVNVSEGHLDWEALEEDERREKAPEAAVTDDDTDDVDDHGFFAVCWIKRAVAVISSTKRGEQKHCHPFEYLSL
jgi:hypothetical protein